jgi:hypothetical protein
VSPKFIFVHILLLFSQPGQSEHHVEELDLPRIQHHDIIVVGNNVSVEVVNQLNSSATKVVWQAFGQKSTPLTITLAYGTD